jgi:hypothetical protein
VPIERPVGFAIKDTDVLAFDARELDAGEKVSHDWVELADQASVLDAGPVFVTTTGCDEVAVEPCAAEKASEVEVVTERVAVGNTGVLVTTFDAVLDPTLFSAKTSKE